MLVANPSADLYGSDRMMFEAVHALLREGREVTVTCSRDGDLVDGLRRRGVDVRILDVPIIRKSMLSPRGAVSLARTAASALPRMRRLIEDVDADVILANTLTLPFWTLAARSCRRPIIVYVHEAESSLSLPARTLLTAPLRLADGVIFNSETSRTVCGALNLERRGRVRVVLNGVAGPPTVQPARERIVGPVRLLYVGRLSPRKGPDLAIEAVALLRDSGTDVELDLVGDVFAGYEWYEAQLHRRVRELGLDDAVRFRGFHSSVWERILEADLMLVPSRGDESFGNVVIEALLSSRPVIVADHSGLREAASGFESVVRVAPESPAAFAAGVRTAVQDWTHLRARAASDAVIAERRMGRTRFHDDFAQALGSLGPSSRSGEWSRAHG